MPAPDLLHIAWASVASLAGRFYLVDHRQLKAEVAALKKASHTASSQLSEHRTSLALHKQELTSFKEAVDELKDAIRENTAETREVKESMIRLETIMKERNG